MPDSTSNWLFSRRADLLLFGGSAAFALLLVALGGAAGLLDGDAPPWLFLLGILGVDVAHVWSTGFACTSIREWPTPERLAPVRGVTAPRMGRRRRRVLRLAPGLLAGARLPRGLPLRAPAVRLGHALPPQNGERDAAFGRRLDARDVYAATLYPLLCGTRTCRAGSSGSCDGDFVGAPAAGRRPARPRALRRGLRGLAGRVARARAGAARVVGQASSSSLTTAARWYLGIVVFDSDYAFTVTNVFVHGVPYLGLVWFTSKARADARRAAGARPLVDRGLASLPLFLLPLLAIAFAEEWGWDRLVWHDNPRFFPGAAAEPGALALVLLVPLLALPQATHYVWDAFLWKVKPANAGAVGALGIR